MDASSEVDGTVDIVVDMVVMGLTGGVDGHPVAGQPREGKTKDHADEVCGWEAGDRTLNTDSKGRRVACYTTSHR